MLEGSIVYKEDAEGGEEETTDGVGGGRGRGGGGRDDGSATADIESDSEETRAAWLEEMMVEAASLYLYFSISAFTALSSVCREWTWCCKAEIAPMHP